MRWLSILVIALALVAAGCGGSDDEPSASDETTVEETLTDETTTDDETTTEDDETTDGDADFNFADEDCQSLVAAFVAVGSALSSAGGGGDLAEQTEAFAELADDVPDEIRDAVETLAAAYGQYAEVVQDAGIEPGEIPTAEQAQELAAALESVGTEDVSAASERLNAWTTENCS